jgi:hypothetical protein
MIAIGVPISDQIKDLDRKKEPVEVFAFEWTESIHESGYSIVSLHKSKLSAYKAMKAEIYKRWYETRSHGIYGKWMKQDPLRFCGWQVRAIKLEE